MSIVEYVWAMARSSTTSDVFNAIAEELSMPQPQVSKHLRVLSDVGLVRCRADGRRRLYRVQPARLRPLQEWLTKYEQAVDDRLDRIDDYLKELQREGEMQ
ncbi:MAG TPA: helix-turn-helix domain-containing protein [Jatrophihabitans sp.]|jgi:DNA-binding transcriptional ArsR family regulator